MEMKMKSPGQCLHRQRLAPQSGSREKARVFLPMTLRQKLRRLMEEPPAAEKDRANMQGSPTPRQTPREKYIAHQHADLAGARLLPQSKMKKQRIQRRGPQCGRVLSATRIHSKVVARPWPEVKADEEVLSSAKTVGRALLGGVRLTAFPASKNPLSARTMLSWFPHPIRLRSVFRAPRQDT